MLQSDRAKHTCKVFDYERDVAESRLVEVVPLFALVVELLDPRLIGALWHPALLVQQVQDAQLALDQVDAGLVVVKLDHRPLDPLLQVLFLFKLEHMLQKNNQK